jgi:tetratricopeptide (TPR) repeat protein
MSEDARDEAQRLLNLALNAQGVDDHQAALDLYLQALPLYQTIGDESAEGTILNNIGAAYYALDDHDHALDYYQRALSVRRVLDDGRDIGGTLNNIGMLYYKQLNGEKAYAYFAEALPEVIRAEYGFGEAMIHAKIGFALWLLDQRDLALEHMETARDLKAKLGLSSASEEEVLAHWRTEMHS